MTADPQPSVDDIAAAQEALREAKREAVAAKNEVVRAHAQLAELVARRMGLDAGNTALGVHECLESPAGVCIYDADADPAYDYCIVCGCPADRS